MQNARVDRAETVQTRTQGLGRIGAAVVGQLGQLVLTGIGGASCQGHTALLAEAFVGDMFAKDVLGHAAVRVLDGDLAGTGVEPAVAVAVAYAAVALGNEVALFVGRESVVERLAAHGEAHGTAVAAAVVDGGLAAASRLACGLGARKLWRLVRRRQRSAVKAM